MNDLDKLNDDINLLREEIRGLEEDSKNLEQSIEEKQNEIDDLEKQQEVKSLNDNLELTQNQAQDLKTDTKPIEKETLDEKVKVTDLKNRRNNDDGKLNSAFRQMQKEEAKNVFYGENDVISRPGFDSIESFDKGIRNVKEIINDYDSLLLENQNKLKNIIKSLDLYTKYPEVALPDQVEDLKEEYEQLIIKQRDYLEKQTKEKKNFEEIMEAKKEFVREMRAVYKNQAKDKAKILDEYSVRQREMKNLEAKINIGTATALDRARYDALKNEIIPDMNEILGIKDKSLESNDKVETSEVNEETGQEVVNNGENSEDPETNEEDNGIEIVNEEDGSELTKKQKFKKIAKTVLKIAAVVGAVALGVGVVSTFVNGGAPLSQLMHTMHGIVNSMHDVATSVDPSQMNLDSTSVGDYSSIYSSNDDVMNGVNAMTPNEWASDNIVGYSDPNNVVTPAHTIGDILDAQNRGVDVQSIAVGNGSFAPGKVSGFVDVDTINNVIGGHTR